LFVGFFAERNQGILFYNDCMRVEVDMSGRIEETNRPTVLALANGTFASIRISAKDKRTILKTLRYFRPKWSDTLISVFVFSVLLYLLLKNYIRKTNQVVVDNEYVGYGAVIKNRVLTLCRKAGIKTSGDKIDFKRIGKNSPAHNLALATFRGVSKPTKKVLTKEVLKFFSIKK